MEPQRITKLNSRAKLLAMLKVLLLPSVILVALVFYYVQVRNNEKESALLDMNQTLGIGYVRCNGGETQNLVDKKLITYDDQGMFRRDKDGKSIDAKNTSTHNIFITT